MSLFKNNMPFDPVEGFFSGFTSILARIFIGWVAIFLACALCYLGGLGFNPGFIYAWALGLVGMIFYWATYGPWFILGLAAIITMFFCLWSFVHDTGGKFTFFLMFTAAAVYFFPFVIEHNSYDESHWLRTTIAYGIVTALYWLLSPVINLLSPQSPEEIEVAAPLAESPADSDSAHFTPIHPDFQEYDPTPLDPADHPHELDNPLRPSDTIPADFDYDNAGPEPLPPEDHDLR